MRDARPTAESFRREFVERDIRNAPRNGGGGVRNEIEQSGKEEKKKSPAV